MCATLIAPVPKWYRKPTPWWIEGVEEKKLASIAEVDEELIVEVEAAIYVAPQLENGVAGRCQNALIDLKKGYVRLWRLRRRLVEKLRLKWRL